MSSSPLSPRRSNPWLVALGVSSGLSVPEIARAGVELELVAAGTPGLTCAAIEYDCASPSSVQLRVDGDLAVDYTASGDAASAPRAPCIDEAPFGAGQHQLLVTATCGATTTAAAVMATFDAPPVGLDGVEHLAFSWSKGDTVAFVLDAQGPALDIAVDFSAADSGYGSGQEIVTPLGGDTYLVTYTLSNNNSRPAGAYRLPIEISDGLVTRTHPQAVTLRYTPASAGVVEFADSVGGEFVVGALPAGQRIDLAAVPGTFKITALTKTEASLTGKVWSQSSLDGETLIVNIADGGGYATADLAISGSSCGQGGCTVGIHTTLALRADHVDDVDPGQSIPVDLTLGTYKPGGATFTAPFSPASPWFVSNPPPNTISMSGQVTYDRLRQISEPDPDAARHPQYGQAHKVIEEEPVRRALIQITDQCGHAYSVQTRSDGVWQRYVPRQCSSRSYSVTVKPRSVYGRYRVAAVDANDLDHSSALGAAVINTSAHDFGKRYYTEADPEHGEFAPFMVGVRVQEWSKPLVVDEVYPYPELAFKYSPGVQTAASCGNTSCYSNQVVKVCATADNPDHRDEWVLTHEAFHWFQDMFMIELDGNTSPNPMAGAFGEAFATVMPAVMGGHAWLTNDWGAVMNAELLDYQGNHKHADGGDGPWTPALPLDLYTTTADNGSGGWTWRVLWDFFDGAGLEPAGEFTRYDDGDGLIEAANPVMTDYGLDFDVVGAPHVLLDVLLGYVGGNHMPENPSLPDIDGRGGVGLDLTEFLDGVLCRGHESWTDMQIIVEDMMDFDYDPAGAPASCP